MKQNAEGAMVRHYRYGFVFAVLCSLLVACGGGGGGAGGGGSNILNDPNPPDPSFLEGSTPLPSNYPDPINISYTDKLGNNLQFTAIPGRVIVLFDSTTTEQMATNIVISHGGTILSKIPKAGYYYVSVVQGNEPTFIYDVRDIEGVVLVELDIVMVDAQGISTHPPEWPAWSQAEMAYLNAIKFPEAYEKINRPEIISRLNNPKITIAVLDSGFNNENGYEAVPAYTYINDLKGRVNNPPFPRNDWSPDKDGKLGRNVHGFLVTTLIGANWNNNKPIGINPFSPIEAHIALPPAFRHHLLSSEFYNIIVSVAERGAEVANSSAEIRYDAFLSQNTKLYWIQLFKTLNHLVGTLNERGKKFILVKSGGNIGLEIRKEDLGFNKNENFLIIGSYKADYGGNLIDVSKVVNWGSAFDIYVPGWNYDGEYAEYPFYRTDNSTEWLPGTSFAAPIVTGVASMVWELNPSASPAEITRIITDSAKNHNGFKVLNYSDAISIAISPLNLIKLFDAVPVTASGYDATDPAFAKWYRRKELVLECASSPITAKISSKYDGTGGLVVDNFFAVNLVDVCTGGLVGCGTQGNCAVNCYTAENVTPSDIGADALAVYSPVSPLDISGMLFQGRNVRTFDLMDWGVYRANTDLWLVTNCSIALNVTVSITPTKATLLPGETQQFTATVTGSANPSVNWTVQEGSAGGTITSGGLYTAPGTPGAYHVIATSQADNIKSATATVTVTSVGDTIPPTLESSNPPNGAQSVPLALSSISFSFNEAMGPGYSVSWGGLDQSYFSAPTWSGDKRTIAFPLTKSLTPLTTVSWVLTGSSQPGYFADLAGNPLTPISVSGSFSTGSSSISGWARTYGGTQSDYATSIQTLPGNGYIVAGYTNSFIIPPTTNSAWILKLTEDGTITSQKAFNGAYYQDVYKIQVTNDGGYIMTGRIGMLDFYHNDIWVVKFNLDGSIAWQKSYGGPEQEFSLSIQQTNDGGYIVVGNSESFAVNNNTSIWVLKLNQDGSVAWQKSYGGGLSSSEELHGSIKQTSDGGYILVGGTSTFSSDPGLPGNPISDFWVLKLNSNGTVAWEKSLGTDYTDVADFVEQTSDGGYIVMGWSGIEYGPHLWIVKLNIDGSVAWQKIYKNAMAMNLKKTQDGGYILAGRCDIDLCIIKLDSNGTIAWQKSYGKEGVVSFGGEIQETSDGGYIVAGSTGSASSLEDMWVLKVSNTGDITFNANSGFTMKETNIIPLDTNVVPRTTNSVIIDTNASVNNTNMMPTNTVASIAVQAP